MFILQPILYLALEIYAALELAEIGEFMKISCVILAD
jgi:hypothetical protein